MDCNVQLMSRSCVTTVFLWAVGILLFLDRITTSQELDYQFDLPFYESPGKWFTCDKGWNGVGNNCLLLETDRATYDEAQTFCESYGAELLKIQSLHDNVVYGEILRTRAELTPDLRYFWIGLSRNGSGTYVWGDGEVALANQGFWTLNQPQSFQLGFRQCTYLGVNNATDFGLYRWALGDCQQRLPFVCQTSACAISDFRCEDGKQCINSDWVCDNTPDCQDQSDELNCNGTCGESLQGTHGTFHSPNHNSSYPSYSFCHWKITSPLGTRIQLHFHSFDLEAPYDNVSIYDGALASDPLVGIFAGNHTPSIPLSSTNFILVIFQSDQNIAGTGFLVTWTAENISCGGLIYTDNQPRLISSPNYMNRSYPENLVCDWHLSDPNRESIIHISFPNFSLAGPGDWLEVRDGSTEHDGLFGRYTGDSLPNVLISSGPHLFVRFRTNQAVGALGFMGISQNGCHHKSIGPDNAAIYTSPGYGVTNYPNNLNCSWIYSGESPATLIFHHIQIEPNYDQLQVKVGNETNFRLISNHDELSRLRSTSGHYLIKFSSDGQVSMKGWKLSISQDCQEPSSLPDHISISSRSHNFSYGSSVWFKCDEGYIISNENQIVCQLGGKWNASIPTCKLITCGPVGIPQNGSLESLNSTLYGGLAVFMCDIGFRMNGNITSSCTAQGWTPLPVCEEVSCPKLHPPPYSDNTIYPESNKFGAKVIYSCKTGYRLIGSSVSVCGEEGMWSHASPQCLAPFCEEINIPNAMFNTSSPIGGDYMGVYCANGYVLTGEGVLYCNTSGLYETAFPTCSDFDECSMEEKNPCQPHNCHNIPGSYICQCNQGYRHRNGSHGRQCEDVDECSLFFPCENSCKNLNGSYHCGCSASQLLYTGPEVRVQGQKVLKPHFSCVKTCSAFTVQNNGTVYANTTIWNDLYIYPTSLFIHCPFGTSPDGPTTVYCQEDGKWSHSITQCDHLYCPVLSPPLNGYVHYSDNTRKVGTMATYQCNSGFQINFASQKLCQLEDADEAFWEGNSTLPTCQMVQCSPLMAPQFGDVSSNSTSYGAQAEYKCQCGYSLVGSKHRTCTKDGIWNGVNAFCIRATCPVPRPPLYGSIADKMYTSPYFVGTSVYYTCGNRQGYQLTNSKNMSTCVVDKTYDAEIPIRLVVLEMNFTGSERMENASCKQHYESKAMTTLVTADAVQAVCTDVYIRTVKAVSTSTLSTKSISLTLSVAIQSTYGVSKNVCYCEDNLLKTLHTTLTLSENLDSGCPNLTSKNKRQIKSSNWSCPAEYTLENDGATCLLNPEPTCSRTDCLRLPDATIVNVTTSYSQSPVIIEPDDDTLPDGNQVVMSTVTGSMDLSTSMDPQTTAHLETTEFTPEMVTQKTSVTADTVESQTSTVYTTKRPLMLTTNANVAATTEVPTTSTSESATTISLSDVASTKMPTTSTSDVAVSDGLTTRTSNAATPETATANTIVSATANTSTLDISDLMTTELSTTSTNDSTTIILATTSSTNATTTKLSTSGADFTVTTETSTTSKITATTTDATSEVSTTSTSDASSIEVSSTSTATTIDVLTMSLRDAVTTEASTESTRDASTTEASTKSTSDAATTEASTKSTSDSTTTEASTTSKSDAATTEASVTSTSDAITTKASTTSASDVATTEVSTTSKSDAATTESSTTSKSDAATTEASIKSTSDAATTEASTKSISDAATTEILTTETAIAEATTTSVATSAEEATTSVRTSVKKSSTSVATFAEESSTSVATSAESSTMTTNDAVTTALVTKSTTVSVTTEASISDKDITKTSATTMVDVSISEASTINKISAATTKGSFRDTAATEASSTSTATTTKVSTTNRNDTATTKVPATSSSTEASVTNTSDAATAEASTTKTTDAGTTKDQATSASDTVITTMSTKGPTDAATTEVSTKSTSDAATTEVFDSSSSGGASAVSTSTTEVSTKSTSDAATTEVFDSSTSGGGAAVTTTTTTTTEVSTMSTRDTMTTDKLTTNTVVSVSPRVSTTSITDAPSSTEVPKTSTSHTTTPQVLTTTSDTTTTETSATSTSDSVTTEALTTSLSDAATTEASTTSKSDAATTEASATSTSDSVTTEALTTSTSDAATTEASTTSKSDTTTTETSVTSTSDSVTTEALTTSTSDAATTEASTTSKSDAATTEASATSTSDSVTTEALTTSTSDAATTEASTTSKSDAATTEASATSTSDSVTTEALTTSTSDAATTEASTTSKSDAATTEVSATSTSDSVTTEALTTSISDTTTTETSTISTSDAAYTKISTKATSDAATTEVLITSTSDEATTDTITTQAPSTTDIAASKVTTTNKSYVATSVSSTASDLVTIEVSTSSTIGETTKEVSTSSKRDTTTTEVLTTSTDDTGFTRFPTTSIIDENTTEIQTTNTTGVNKTEVSTSGTKDATTTKLSSTSTSGVVSTTTARDVSTTEVPATSTSDTATTEVPAASTSDTATTEVPATSTSDTATTEVPVGSTSDAATTEVPAASTSDAATTEVPAASTSDTATTEVPTTTTSDATTTEFSTTSDTTTTKFPTTTTSDATTTVVPAASTIDITTTEVPAASTSVATTTEVPTSTTSDTTTTKIPTTTTSDTATAEVPIISTSDTAITEDTTTTTSDATTSAVTTTDINELATTEVVTTHSKDVTSTDMQTLNPGDAVTTESLRSSTKDMTTTETTEGFTAGSTRRSSDVAASTASDLATDIASTLIASDAATTKPPATNTAITTKASTSSTSDQITTKETTSMTSDAVTTEASITSSRDAATTEASVTSTSDAATTEASIASTSDAATTEALIASTSDAATTEASITSTGDAATTEASITSTSDAATTEASITSTSDAATTEASITSTSDAVTTETSVTSTSDAATTEASVTSTSDAATTEASIPSTSDAATTEASIASTSDSVVITETSITNTSDAATTEASTTSKSDAITTEASITSTSDATTTEASITSTSDAATTEASITSTSDAATTEASLTSTSDAATSEASTTSTSDAATTEASITSTSDATTTEASTRSTNDEITTDVSTTSDTITTKLSTTSSVDATTTKRTTISDTTTTEKPTAIASDASTTTERTTDAATNETSTITTKSEAPATSASDTIRTEVSSTKASDAATTKVPLMSIATTRTATDIAKPSTINIDVATTETSTEITSGGIFTDAPVFTETTQNPATVQPHVSSTWATQDLDSTATQQFTESEKTSQEMVTTTQKATAEPPTITQADMTTTTTQNPTTSEMSTTKPNTTDMTATKATHTPTTVLDTTTQPDTTDLTTTTRQKPTTVLDTTQPDLTTATTEKQTTVINITELSTELTTTQPVTTDVTTTQRPTTVINKTELSTTEITTIQPDTTDVPTTNVLETTEKTLTTDNERTTVPTTDAETTSETIVTTTTTPRTTKTAAPNVAAFNIYPLKVVYTGQMPSSGCETFLRNIGTKVGEYHSIITNAMTSEFPKCVNIAFYINNTTTVDSTQIQIDIQVAIERQKGKNAEKCYQDLTEGKTVFLENKLLSTFKSETSCSFYTGPTVTYDSNEVYTYCPPGYLFNEETFLCDLTTSPQFAGENMNARPATPSIKGQTTESKTTFLSSVETTTAALDKKLDGNISLSGISTTTMAYPEATSVPTDTPYYLLEVNVTLRGTKFNVTSCVESLRGYIEHAVQNKSDTILNNIMSSHGWPLNWSQCKTIKDMVLLNTTGHINIRNDKIYLIVPFAVQSRNVSIGNMESCIYDNVTKYVHSNFYTDLTTILKQVYGVCGAIDLQSYEHNVTVQCPNQYQFHTPSQTCHRYPVTTIPPELSTPSVELMTLPFMPVVDIELTIDFLSSVSSDSIMCNQKLTNLISTALSEQAIVLNQHSEFVSRCANNNIVFQFSDSIKSHRKNTSFVVTVIISFYATSEHVSSMMFNTCFSTVIGKFQMFPSMVLGKSSLETGNSCGRLTIQKAIPINMSNSCMPDYIYLPQYNRCRDRFGAIFTVVIDATYLIFQIQDPLCFSVLTNQVKYHINNFENSMPTTNIIPACNDTILLPINVTANVSTKDGNTQIIFSIQLEFQNLKGNNNRATRCEKEIQSKFLLKGGLKTFLEENVVNETSGSCTIPPNMTSFVIKQMYFQCTDDREWQEETLSCVKSEEFIFNVHSDTTLLLSHSLPSTHDISKTTTLSTVTSEVTNDPQIKPKTTVSDSKTTLIIPLSVIHVLFFTLPNIFSTKSDNNITSEKARSVIASFSSPPELVTDVETRKMEKQSTIKPTESYRSLYTHSNSQFKSLPQTLPTNNEITKYVTHIPVSSQNGHTYYTHSVTQKQWTGTLDNSEVKQVTFNTRTLFETTTSKLLLPDGQSTKTDYMTDVLSTETPQTLLHTLMANTKGQTTLSSLISIQCYTCDESKRADNCKNMPVSCKDREICKTQVTYIKKAAYVTKSCVAIETCEKDQLASSCDPQNYNTQCVYCCTEHFCNDEVTKIQFTGRRRKRSRKLGVTKWTLETILSRPRTKKGIKDKTIPHYWPILSDVVSFETSELNHDVPVVKSSLPQRWKRDTQLMIQTVSDEVTEANVHWQNNVTACIDVEPPQFIDCPSSPVKIPLGRDDPLPREITLPIAKDNSNLPPYVVYDPPAIIKQPYLFQNNTVINITATDYEGNTNYCSFRVLLIDESPPVMECPAEVVYAHYTEASVNVSLRYSNMRNILKIKDLSKWTLHLNPGNGMWIRTRELIDITATATDINGNAASCNFTYEAQGGDISQAYQIEIQVYVKPNMSNSDARSCLRNYTQSLVIHYMNVAKNVCNEGASNDFLIINKAEQLNLSIKKPSVQAYVNMTFSISSNGNSNLSECVGKLISELKSEGSNLYTADGCAPANITLISVSGRYLCPNEYILNTSRNICVQCHRGYYADQTNHICQRCTAENPNNITDCIPCSVKNSPTCLKYCRPGEYSENGLQPCIKCAIGSYTNKSGSTICQVCNQGSTLSIGSTSPTECHDICPAGFYSNTGLNVTECFPCPQNYYSAGPGSTSCTPCPIGTITEGIQSTQMSMCQVYNLCDNCQNNSTCMDVDQGRWYMCVCPPGFHGHNCDQDVDECLSQPCMHEGICHNGMNSYHCTCSEGYTGNHCEVPISGCSSYPCVYGVCTEHANNSHVCTCYPGFTGPSCETNQNDCNSTSCLNGGTCIDQINSFVCNCTGTGYEGTRCDHKRPNLTLNKCFNGDYHQNLDQCSCNSGWSGAYCETRVGNCVDGSHCGSNGHCVEFGVTNVTCICKPGFTGTYCTEKIRKCNSFLCQNNGICEEKGADFACLCPQGYTGRVCEKDIDDCASSPCRNDTTLQCVDGQDTFLCQCVPGWSGSRCDTEITECQSSPCHRGGTCVDLVNDYYCKCPAGFTGKDCSMFSSCLSTPCYNSGTCQYNEMGDFNCLCPKGFTGRTCEQEIDECSSSQCQNGGTCHDFVNDFKCSCLQGFMGQFCEEQEKECLSQPCQNGGTCHEEPSAKFNCTCRKGYTGTQCEIDEDNCASFPCLNGGTCTDLIGGFLCTCPDGFHGNICTADHCEECKNGATCVNGFCQCGRKYTGIDCGKEKFADFDLFFAGHTGNSRMPVEAVQHTEVMSVCLWVRYLHPNGQGTFFTLFAENVEQKMIPALQINGSGIHIQYLAPKTFVRASVNDGRWHHLCYMWTEDQEWIVYLDGLVKETGQDSGSLSSRQSVTLGYTGTNKSHDAIFIGELAHVNMYYFALNDSDIQQMSESCHDNQLPGNRLSWIEFDSYIEGDVKVVRPMLCGSSDCPHGYRGYYCNITIDKVPPTVVNCTADFFVVSDDRRLVMVNWTEPVFSDNVRIMSIEQSHRPGQVFTYGVYDVHYTAYDEDGNSATCSFNIYVTPSHCKMPDKPESVLLDCKEGADFTYCQISCKHPTENAFSEPVPKFYKCGIEGLWDPPRGRNFLLPSCAPTSVPNGAVKGSMGFNGPQCTDQSRNVLKQQFILSMEQWNTQFKLCPEEGCSFDIMVECGAVSEGKKRKRRNADGPYLVLFNFPVNGSSLSNSEVQPLSNLKTSVKNGDFNVNNFAADSNSLVVTADFSCSPGQMLIMEAGAEKCVSCAVGTFFNNITKACELCLEGFYSSDDSQTQCTPCPSGKTTQDRGSTSVTQCYSVCETGHYYGQGQCRKCLHGYYQDQKGQRECKSCPNGQTTESEGAVSKNQCQGGCRPGTELSVRGICVPCGRGTYKENITQNACKKCPYNFTTDGEGATSRDKCNVVLCDRGYYRVLSSNTCDPCPKGLYQPYRGQEKCYACDAGLTTTHRGSVDAMQCVPGDIDECKEGTHTCDINAVCENTVNSYICTCRDNYYGNGTYCQEHTLIKESHDGISSNIIVYGVVGGVSFAIIVAAVLSVIIFWRRSKRRKKLPDDSDVNYQAHPNVHREKERVQFPLVAIPVFNPSFDGSLSRSDPTQSLTGNPSDESGSWQEPLSSESSNSPSFTGAENDSDIMNGNFSIHSDSYF